MDDLRPDHANALDWLGQLPPASIDALITDPPYSSHVRGAARNVNSGKKYCDRRRLHTAPDFMGETMDQRSYGAFTRAWLTAAKPALKPGAYLALFTDWRQLPAMTDAFQIAGYQWRGVAVWDKTQGVRPQKGAYRQQAEFVIWGTNGQKPSAGPVLPGIATAANISRNKKHQTQKPVPIMEWLISITAPGAVICDPFMGSGSTGIAALNTGRKFWGCEGVAEIHTTACDRLKSETGGEKCCA